MSNKPLVVEYNSNQVKDNSVLNMGNSLVAITPPIDSSYWLFRVHLYKRQYVQAFHKFFTLGIGFAIEDEDWNTNLPYSSDPETICNHIWDNHKYPQITKERTIEAIKLLCEACKQYNEKRKSIHQ